MFNFLKEKLSKTVKSISERIEKKEPVVKEVVEKRVVKKEVKGGVIKKVFEKVTKKVLEKKISEKDLSGVLDNLGMSLLEADVAFEVSEKIKDDLKKNLAGKQVKRGKVKEIVVKTFKDSLLEIVDVPRLELKEVVKRSKPSLFVFLGFNGSGKTTSIAKVAYYLKKNGYSTVLAAADSWRSAAIEQLEEHAKKLKVPIIKHRYGADPAAIVFDSVKFCEARGLDVILADTAGRSHTNRNLIDELKKICRVNKPNLKILVLDSLTGNDAIPQARMFNEAVSVDAVVFTKVDVNQKGGAILSVSYLLKKPILFLGVGQNYSDLKEFDKKWFIDQLLS